MTIKTNIKAGTGTVGNGGRLTLNHNETEAVGRTRSLKIKTGVKAGPRSGGGGEWLSNHNETQAKSRGFSVKSGVKAGPIIQVVTGDCGVASRP